MADTSFELGLMAPEEQEMVEYIWKNIPEQDRNGMTKDDILFVLDEMDNYLEEKGLLEVDEKTGEVTYLDGDVDETEQTEYVKKAVQASKRTLTGVQIQLIMDAEMQYGTEQGWYEEE